MRKRSDQKLVMRRVEERHVSGGNKTDCGSLYYIGRRPGKDDRTVIGLAAEANCDGRACG